MSAFTFSQDLFRYVFPSGVPRNSFILLSGEGGSGKSVLLAHLVKDVLGAGEPAIYVTMDDDPATVLAQLKSFKVDVDHYCKEGQLLLVDGFSYLLKVKKGLGKCVVDEVSPENPDGIVSTLIKLTESRGFFNKGAVVIDSLNESMITLDPSRFAMLVKSIRANIAKSRGVLTVATLHTSTTSLRDYMLLIEHIVDGLIETSNIPPEVSQQIPIFVRALVVKRMKGASYRQGTVLFGIDEEGVKPVVFKIKGH
ncbi:MAG: RAD55 family ATPase [Desulfurococcaceae archaeon]|jgi:KaiC/GvpD/RAD55 family RecA-like ATPase